MRHFTVVYLHQFQNPYHHLHRRHHFLLPVSKESGFFLKLNNLGRRNKRIMRNRTLYCHPLTEVNTIFIKLKQELLFTKPIRFPPAPFCWGKFGCKLQAFSFTKYKQFIMFSTDRCNMLKARLWRIFGPFQFDELFWPVTYN